ALYEIAGIESGPGRSQDALRLYEGLVQSRWTLQKSSYVYYSAQARDWIPDIDARANLIEREQMKLALSSFAEQFVDTPRAFESGEGTSFVAFWRNEPFAAILFGEAFVRSVLLSAAN